MTCPSEPVKNLNNPYAHRHEHHHDEEIGRERQTHAPDSFTPRRLISMTKKISATEISTRYGSSAGNADVIWATPDEIDTATVRM